LTPQDITIARIGLFPYRKPNRGRVGFWWRRHWLSKGPLKATLLRRAVADMGWDDGHPVFPAAVSYLERQTRVRTFWLPDDEHDG
jgi:hypothetical protein